MGSEARLTCIQVLFNFNLSIPGTHILQSKIVYDANCAFHAEQMLLLLTFHGILVDGSKVWQMLSWRMKN